MSVLEDKIEHVVVLMLENRSFDSMLGSVPRNNSRCGCIRGRRRQTQVDSGIMSGCRSSREQ